MKININGYTRDMSKEEVEEAMKMIITDDASEDNKEEGED